MARSWKSGTNHRFSIKEGAFHEYISDYWRLRTSLTVASFLGERGEFNCLFQRTAKTQRELRPVACYLLPFLFLWGGHLCGLRRSERDAEWGVPLRCLSLLYITQQYVESSSPLLPSTAGPNNRSIVLPEIKTSTIVAVENNASYWRHDVTWRVRDSACVSS